ncbi:hypothetical protein PR048_021153, partial [Dryococelus australis]
MFGQIVESHKTITGGTYFTTIDQNFLVSGHSFLLCDRDFALIGRRKKKSTVYHPNQWLEVIVNASPAFSAYYMDKEDFMDLSAIEGISHHKNQILFERESVITPTTLAQLCNTAITQRKEIFTSDSYKEREKKDLLDMCRFLPVQYRDFYESLCAVE